VRILHVGWGFTPWRPGGLIRYTEDVAAGQAARGHQVAYFLSGRHYPFVGGPRLKRWRRDGVRMYELVNPPVVAGLEAGTRDPLRELDEPLSERAFARVLEDERPEVVHVQELAGLPSSLLEVARERRVPVLMTLHDYFPLCATTRLFDAGGHVCTRLDVGEECVLNNALAPADARPLMAHTLRFELTRAKERLPLLRRASFAGLLPFVMPLTALAAGRGELAAPDPDPEPAPAADYGRRREVNLRRLSAVDRLVANSPRTAEMYRLRGVDTSRLTTMRLTLRDIEELRPRERTRAPRSPLTLVTLSGFASVSKGALILLDALERLADLRGRFRLVAAGNVDPGLVATLRAAEGVELAGLYGRRELDRLLDRVDVGVLPSACEETFGLTAVEMLAKGVPVIANARGGLGEHVHGGRTGWLNRSASGAELADIVRRLVDSPDEVDERRRAAIAMRGEIVKPFAAHLDEIEAAYADINAAPA
jgi:glycosyltransferase involved in cell wall biosynthesis